MLSERLRANAEAAPWVIEEVKRLEADLAAARAERDELTKALTDIRDATYYKVIDYRMEASQLAAFVNGRARAALAALPKEDEA